MCAHPPSFLRLLVSEKTTLPKIRFRELGIAEA
jgi:hypothetical protein